MANKDIKNKWLNEARAKFSVGDRVEGSVIANSTVDSEDMVCKGIVEDKYEHFISVRLNLGFVTCYTYHQIHIGRLKKIYEVIK